MKFTMFDLFLQHLDEALSIVKGLKKSAGMFGSQFYLVV